MASILQGKCKNCGYETPTFIEATGAIIVDEGARIRPHLTHEDSPRIVVLGHPLEMVIEAEVGITYQDAQKAGRYILICERCCGSCGCFYESRVLGFPQLALGCWPPIIISLISGIVVGVATRSIPLTITAIWVLLLLAMSSIDLVAKRLILRRESRIADAFCTSESCPECGSNRPKTRGVLPCPGCRQKSMKIKMVAIS